MLERVGIFLKKHKKHTFFRRHSSQARETLDRLRGGPGSVVEVDVGLGKSTRELVDLVIELVVLCIALAVSIGESVVCCNI